MKQEQEQEQARQEDESHHLQHAAEHEQPGKRMTVMGYLVILFAAAFLLLLLSYFMQQRTNAETIEGLKQSVSAVQSIDRMKEEKEALALERDALAEQVEALESQFFTLTEERDTLQTQSDKLVLSAEAMDWFWRIQRDVSRGRYRSARALVEDFRATGLESTLPTDHPADPDGPSPAEQYQEILDVLY